MLDRISRKIAGLRIYHLILLAVAAVLALNAYCDESAMMRRQIALQKKIWRGEVNAMLYRHLVDSNRDGFLVTDYQGVKYLPGFESRTIIADLETLDEFSAGAALPGVKYVLLRVAHPSKIEDLVAARTAAGVFQPIAAVKGFSLIKVR